MSATRIYLVETSIGKDLVFKTRRLVRAKTQHQARQHVIRDQVSAWVATQDDLVKYVPDGVEDANQPETEPDAVDG